jgi:hypothetical protein
MEHPLKEIKAVTVLVMQAQVPQLQVVEVVWVPLVVMLRAELAELVVLDFLLLLQELHFFMLVVVVVAQQTALGELVGLV